MIPYGNSACPEAKIALNVLVREARYSQRRCESTEWRSGVHCKRSDGETVKIINVALGIGTAFVISSLVALGIAAFYPSPTMPSAGDLVVEASYTQCAANDAACIAARTQARKKEDAQQKAYRDNSRLYGRNFFYIANLLGALVFAAGMLLVLSGRLAGGGIPVGLMFAGFWIMLYGYGRGWDGVGTKTMFFVGLLLAAIVLGGSGWLLQRRQLARSRP